MFAALTGAGLSAAAGLNAYIPFLMVALVARFSDVIVLPSQFAWIESPWAIGGATFLLLAEMVLDKIPAIDSMNDMIGTAVRPTVGGVVFAATQAADQQLDQASWMQQYPWVGAIGGVIIAGIVHTTKAATRPAVNVTTAGMGAPVLSGVEDATSLGMSVLAIFTPLLVIIGLIAMGVGIFWLWRRIARYRKRRRATGAYA
ncbi:uncharacterized protein DUF4126 [Barrientosiimonas humi]|uniref:Uncharacterized protein DUF4126 n=1 Tax=Barrientosiimonas humi TaxID=999931 RepID=A0A542XEP1_9MICO|nr:DUF4126 domain-containing protein [Barrientosiimonas humi]TQL34290.1 uncharacterized protein DUF4126 [Barrientosiimonas humi]CAG7574281.1 hypothetical protein BH39T_PBIAJDOK_02927 [Barrientosiimonas humi]